MGATYLSLALSYLAIMVPTMPHRPPQQKTLSH